MSTEIYGLVLVGGESRRMGSDKALLSYDGKATQLERTAALLQSVCPRVFISQREEQPFPTPEGTEAIFDHVEEARGPLRGILSAMHAHPDALAGAGLRLAQSDQRRPGKADRRIPSRADIRIDRLPQHA